MAKFEWPGGNWLATDRTGGPVDQILDQVRRQVPEFVVGRISGSTHMPPGDDNVYFLGDNIDRDIVQIDTHEDGTPPFLIEHIDPTIGRTTIDDPTEAARLIVAWLRPFDH